MMTNDDSSTVGSGDLNHQIANELRRFMSESKRYKRCALRAHQCRSPSKATTKPARERGRGGGGSTPPALCVVIALLFNRTEAPPR
jgi:hypothetical protein